MKNTDTATIYVSKGESIKVVPVPNLKGTTQEAAQSLLENLKLKLGNVYYVESDKPEGTIVEQQPQHEIRVAEGTAVDIRISRAKEEDDEPANSTEPDTEDESEPSKPPIRPVPNTLE